MDKKRVHQNRKVISFIPDGEFYYKKALKAMQQDRFTEAHKYLKRATELNPEDPEILMHYGILQMEEGAFKEAEETLQQAYVLAPELADITFYLAEVHAHMNLLIEAKGYAEQYLKMDAGGPFADDAEEIIDFIEQNDPFGDEDYEVYVLQEKARKQMEDGEFKEAIALLENIITDYPQLWAAYNNLALAYFYLGKIERAYETLDEVLSQNEGNIHALCNLAVFYYYEEKNEQLEQLLNMLRKIHPYAVEQRYKLGATFSLVGQHEEAFKQFRKLQKHGFEGDAGFYFWLAHSAYFTGHDNIAKKAYAKLLEIDPSKEGFEPWQDVEEKIEPNSVEQDRTFLLNKIQNSYRSERMFGFYLLGKSGYKQELLAHPTYIQLEKLTVEEKVFLMSSLGEEFAFGETSDPAHVRAYEITEILYKNYCPLNYEAAHLFQMWFTLCERAMEAAYRFPNPMALAAAIDFMFRSARFDRVTKTGMAKKYGISTPTLTKYVNELIAFLPYTD